MFETTLSSLIVQVMSSHGIAVTDCEVVNQATQQRTFPNKGIQGPTRSKEQHVIVSSDVVATVTVESLSA